MFLQVPSNLISNLVKGLQGRSSARGKGALIMKQKSFRKAIIVFAAIFFVLAGMAGVFSSITLAEDKREIGPNDIQGKVLSVRTYFFGGGSIELKSDLTEKVYKFDMVADTVCIPDRYFAIGDTIKVTYYYDRGKLKAARVQLVQSRQ
jgi:hypothetical protein